MRPWPLCIVVLALAVGGCASNRGTSPPSLRPLAGAPGPSSPGAAAHPGQPPSATPTSSPSAIPPTAQPALRVNFLPGGAPSQVFVTDEGPTHPGHAYAIVVQDEGASAPRAVVLAEVSTVGSAPTVQATDLTGGGMPDLVVSYGIGANADHLTIFQRRPSGWLRIFDDSGHAGFVSLPGSPIPLILETHCCGAAVWGYRWDTAAQRYLSLSADDLRAAVAVDHLGYPVTATPTREVPQIPQAV